MDDQAAKLIAGHAGICAVPVEVLVTPGRARSAKRDMERRAVQNDLGGLRTRGHAARDWRSVHQGHHQP